MAIILVSSRTGNAVGFWAFCVGINIWGQIWDIVSRNSETIVRNPEEDLFLEMLGGRAHTKPKGDKVVRPKNTENSGNEAESGGV